MAKRNVRAHKLQGRSRQTLAPRAKAAKSTFDNVTSSVTDFTGKIPSSAIYWGLGALALGAAAYGAYIYRDRIVEMYEDTMESLQNDESETDSEAVSTPSQSARKSKSNSSLSTADQH